MVNRVYEYMGRHQMAAEGTRVLAAVSGGADSMCLLEVLRELKDRMGFRLRVLHVHHGLRESAEGDLAHVESYCESAGIPFQAVRVEAGSYAAQSGMSVEEAARTLRYEALMKAADEWDEEARAGLAPEAVSGTAEAPWGTLEAPSGAAEAPSGAADTGDSACRIAVAHHIEDQAETVLFNLVRGSRLAGLRGMLPVNGRIIRPMLELSRGEIEAFLNERGISWREDETNEDIRYSRNRLRKEVMPLLRQINAGAVEHIARAAQEAAQTESYLRGETERVLEAGCVREPVPGRQVPVIKMKIPVLLKEADLIRRRAVYALIAEAAGGRKDLQDVHVRAVLELAQKQGNGVLDVVDSVSVRKSYGLLYFYKGGVPEDVLSEAARWPKSAGEYSCRAFPFGGDLASVPRNQYTKWFDYDKIGTFPEFRNRREGDRITLDGSGKTKSIARYMIDAKIPAQLRGQIVLPAAESEILWVPMPSAEEAADTAGRINAAFKVSPETRRILEIRWEPDTGISHS